MDERSAPAHLEGGVSFMATKLVIVELPTKAKTISKVLGRAYQVRASGGHVRDLPKTTLGVDTENGFEPQYLVSRDKAKTVKDLRELVQAAGSVYLATDPDREGEAIAWHIAEATGAHGGGRTVQRISFHEITPEAIREAVAHPREIDMHLVTPSRPAACSTGWSATSSARCSGRRCSAGSPPGACSRSPCAWSSSASARSRPSCRSSTGPSRPTCARKTPRAAR